MGKKTKVYWPSWCYGPDGAAAIFKSEEEVPPGWADSPSKARELDDVGRDSGDKDEVEEIEEWTLETSPENYLERWPEGPRAELAKKILSQKVETANAAMSDALSEARRTLREAGVDIGEDATEEEILEALEALE